MTTTDLSTAVMIAASLAGMGGGCAGDEDDQASIAQPITGPAPDYSVAVVTDPPAAALNGTTFAITTTVQNGGDAAATVASTTRYYLSLDTLAGGDIAFVQNATVPPLAAGGVNVQTVNLAIPSGVSSGSYFIVACADGRKTIAESNELNNCAASAGAVAVTGPDLVIESLAEPPAAAANGATFAIATAVRNVGDGAAILSTTTRYYLSSDQVDGNDIAFIQNAVVPPLGAGDRNVQNVSLTVPSGVAGGSYYLRACADGLKKLAEKDERNNCAFSGGTVAITGADLVVESVGEPPVRLELGKPFSITDTTRNQGDAPAGASNTGYYLSPTPAIGTGTGAVKLKATRSVIALAPGQAMGGTITAQVPQLPPGSYYLVACADIRKTIGESDDRNNCTASMGTAAIDWPDLVVTAVSSTPTRVVWGQLLTITNTVTNAGAGLAGATASYITLSVDDQPDGNDIPFTYIGVPELGAGQSASVSRAELVWSYIPPGAYHVIACLDPWNEVHETSETNNCRVEATTITIVSPVCGNGVVEGGEACDDSNHTNDDGCDNDCRLSAVTQVTAGYNHTCALLRTGDVRCWGDGSRGQLGYGLAGAGLTCESPAERGTVDVGGKVVELAAGAFHTCARLETGAVRCWGANDVGQLGYGTVETIGDDETPAAAGDVPLGGTAVQLAASWSTTCARLDTGAVRCWGYGGDGALGYGNTETIGDNETPADVGDVPLGAIATSIDTGVHHTCALLVGGGIRCWGQPQYLGTNTFEAIGDDEIPALAADVNLGGVAVVLDVAGWSSCARMADSLYSLRCWGESTYGDLGYGNTNTVGYGNTSTPAAAGNVLIASAIRKLSGSYHHHCMVTTSGYVECWGYGAAGQLGHASTANVGDDEPAAYGGSVHLGADYDTGTGQIATGGLHTCALVQPSAFGKPATASVWCWGAGALGQLGRGCDHLESIGDDEVPALGGFVEMF